MTIATTFIGIDLAWKSERNPTGVAVLQGDRQGARLTVLSTIYPEMSVAKFVAANATADTVVAIDAPLIIVNETGQRRCETAVGRRYGSREASCHTSNLGLYPSASSVALTAELASHGFVHIGPMPFKQDLKLKSNKLGVRKVSLPPLSGGTELHPQLHGRLMAEVYPHAAMVALWNLPKTIKYKRGSALENRKGLNTLRTHLSQLSKAEPPLPRSGVLSELLTAELNQLSGRKLKVLRQAAKGFSRRKQQPKG